MCRDLDGLIVASPANPTGTMIAPADLARLSDYCRDRGIRLVSDEIYHGITYEGDAATARAFGREAIVVNSFSKYYSMTGWRLGWMLVPPDLARSVECLAQNFYISPPALSQLAAVAAFGCRAELDGHVARYRANRDLLIAHPEASRAHPLRAGRRRVLSLCRRLVADPRQRGFLPPDARRDRGRGHPGPRFRPDPRRRLGALLSFAGSTEDIAEAAALLARLATEAEVELNATPARGRIYRLLVRLDDGSRPSPEWRRGATAGRRRVWSTSSPGLRGSS